MAALLRGNNLLAAVKTNPYLELLVEIEARAFAFRVYTTWKVLPRIQFAQASNIRRPFVGLRQYSHSHRRLFSIRKARCWICVPGATITLTLEGTWGGIYRVASV